MAERFENIASQLVIKIDGNDLTQEARAALQSASVDQHTYLPDMFTMRFSDRGFRFMDGGTFDLTKSVEISGLDENRQEVVLFKGEITSLEPVYEQGMVPSLVVRGYDKSHRMYRETRSKAYLNVKDSDLAEEIAGAYNLQTEIETTSTVYDHVYQHNQSDLHFLMQRAYRIGYECFVAGEKLYFRKPPQTGNAAVTLTYGRNLQSFHVRMSAAEQVDEVIVKGWDPAQKAAITGQASTGQLYPDIGESRNGAQMSQPFGNGKLVIVNHPVISQAEANALAEARLNELSGSFIEAEGVATRQPKIAAGELIEIEGLGERMSGKYLVTSATHHYDSQGFQTLFSVRGARTGQLAEQISHAEPVQRWDGVVIAIVTNTEDPEKQGRVKVKFPWMSDEHESAWARLVGPGAGPNAGMILIPDVDDEVLVAFEHGDFNRPFILGGLWNGQNTLPEQAESASSGDEPKVRVWRSRSGHFILMDDAQEKKLEIKTVDGNFILLDDQNKKLVISTSSGVKIEMDDNSTNMNIETGNKLTVKTGGNLELEASGNLSVKASGNLDLQANGQVTVKGAVINLN